jgi:PAS domain S-box-containing protein
MWRPGRNWYELGKKGDLVVFWASGIALLAMLTWICFWLDLSFATTALVHLIAIAILSLMDSFVSSAIFSIVALTCLNYFFVPPLFTLHVASSEDVVTLASFLVTSFIITGLVRRIREYASTQREQARLLDLTHDAVFVRDNEDVIVYWNQGAERLYGWSAQEAIGRVSHELLLTAFPAPLTEIKQALLDTGLWEGELNHTTRKGITVTTSGRWSLQRSDEGRPVSTLEINRDITERKRAEEALRASQAAYLAEAQKLSQTGSFGWNVVGGEIFWSDQTFAIYGYDVSAIPSVDMVLARVHGEDLEHVRGLFRRAVTQREGFDSEHRLLMPDGKLKHVHVLFRALTAASPVAQFAGAVMDITDRKEAFAALERSEARYRDLFHQMPIALWQTNSTEQRAMMKELRDQGVSDISAYIDAHPEFVQTAMDAARVDEANRRAVELFGGQEVGDLLGPSGRYWQSRPDTYRQILEARWRGDTFFEAKTQMNALDGRPIDGLLTIAAPPSLSVLGVNLIGFVDMTAQKQSLAALQESEARFQDLQANFAHAARVSILGELTASIAHEIYQPLAAISTNAGVALRWLGRPQPDVAEVQDLTQRIVGDARRAADIIDRIRAMAARRALEPAIFPLDDVIREALLFLRHEVQARKAKVSHHPAQEAPQVVGDRTQLQQVIVNLAVNAMQAMAAAGRKDPRIAIRTSWSNGVMGCVVEDSGPGIAPEHLSRLFEGFFTTKPGGMGMGLPICRSIIEAHGGRITGDNNSAIGGARFSFTLPPAV